MVISPKAIMHELKKIIIAILNENCDMFDDISWMNKN